MRFCPFCATIADVPVQRAQRTPPVIVTPAVAQPPPVAPAPHVPAPAAGPGPARSASTVQPIVPVVLLRNRFQRRSPAPDRVVAARRPAPTAAQRAARAAARRKLLLAAIILGCGAILWHHLTGGPHGTVTVHLTRNASGEVQVDGRSAGASEQALRLAPGRHVVGFEADAWSTAPVVIRLRDGETRTVNLVPVPHRAMLAVASAPAGARLELDHPPEATRRLGRAPATLSLLPGSYRISATLPGYQPLERSIELSAGEHRSLVLTLQADPVRTLHLLAPTGLWSDPVTIEPDSRFTLLLHGRVRVRANGRVVLLEGGQPANLGALVDRRLSFTAVGNDAVPLDLLIRSINAPG